MAQVEMRLDTIQLQANVAELTPKINKTLTLTTDFAAGRGMDVMKRKAPWTDRTGNARTGLVAVAEHSGAATMTGGATGFSQHKITMAHGVDYGIWLEVANLGKFQIIMPVLVATAQELMKALQDMFSKFDVPPELKVDVDMPGVVPKGTSQGATQYAGREARAGKRNTKQTARTARTQTTYTTRRPP